MVSAQAQLATAQKNENDTTLRAPVAGVVASINGLVGQQSGSGAHRRRSSSASSLVVVFIGSSIELGLHRRSPT